MSRGALLVLALLLAPGALAAAPRHEVDGRLDAPRGVVLRGDARVLGQGLLEVEAGDGAGVALSFAGLVEGRVVNRTRDKVHVGLPPVAGEPSLSPPGVTRTPIAPAGEGRVENLRCGTRCIVAAFSLDGAGAVGAEGRVDGALAPTAAARVLATSTASDNPRPESQFRYDVPAGSPAADARTLQDARPLTTGRVGLVLSDVAFDLVTERGRLVVDARSGNETTSDAAGRAVTVRHHARHALLVLDGASFDLAPGVPFRVAFPGGAEARVEGALGVRDATGALGVGARREGVLLLDADDLLLTGDVEVRVEPGRTEVQGRVERVVVSGVDVTPRLAADAVGMGGGLAALLGLALLGRLVVAPLYHRLRPSNVLENGNRRRIYEAVRARPGVGVGELMAATGLSRILVRHHLRTLEAHKLVRSTVWRRRRTYALAGEGAGRAACELKDATRRRVASWLARAGRGTQRDLASGLGLSQRLVSYHLARLESSGLVRAEGKNPRSYVPTEQLVRAVAREEGGAAAGLEATAA